SLALCSGAFVCAVTLAEWSPTLVAVSLLPSFAWVLIAKPQAALWLLAWRPKIIVALVAAAGVVVLCGLSLPKLFLDWWSVARGGAYPTTLALLPGGVIMLAAWWRWRDPDARLIGTLALVPHTTLAYEALPVMLIARTWGEARALALGSWIAWIGHRL